MESFLIETTLDFSPHFPSSNFPFLSIQVLEAFFFGEGEKKTKLKAFHCLSDLYS